MSNKNVVLTLDGSLTLGSLKEEKLSDDKITEILKKCKDLKKFTEKVNHILNNEQAHNELFQKLVMYCVLHDKYNLNTQGKMKKSILKRDIIEQLSSIDIS